MNYYELYILLWMVVSGLCLGSFLNVVVYRLPKKLSLSKPRSHCFSCGKQIKPYDLIPVLSYVLLRGRCRFCAVRFSVRYPLVEAACCAIAFLCYWRFGFNYRFAAVFAAMLILLAVSLIDIDTMEIPDSLVLALIIPAVIIGWPPSAEHVIGFFAVSLPMLLLTLAIDGAFGGGDIKLIAVCGYMLGWKSVLLAFFISLIIGGGYASYLLISGKRERGTHIPFGQYLCAGVGVALLWGSEITAAYINLFYI
jgi:leader peptidase (prepilin peptidase)/N-methyltransferase